MAFGAALVLHAAAALIGHRAAGDVTTPTVDIERPVETEIELADSIPESRDDRANDLGSADPPASPQIATAARSRDHRGGLIADGPPTPRETAPTAEPSAEGSYALDPSAGTAPGTDKAGTAIQLGIGEGDWSRWVDPNAPVATSAPRRDGRRELAPAPVSSTGGLAEALEARDQALGLGPAGAVLTAVHDAGYSDIAPALGTAMFSITVLRTGAIDVQLTGASSQTGAWTKVGESIAAAIRRKPPRIAPTRIGVRLGIEVVAEERWPNGQATRHDSGPKIVAAAPKFEGTETAKQQLLERNPAAVPTPDEAPGKPPLQANVDSPGVFVQGRGKVCSYRVGLSLIPISGGCDPANIGQPARRVVSTRVVSQTML
jgi:hypothetical protein